MATRTDDEQTRFLIAAVTASLVRAIDGGLDDFQYRFETHLAKISGQLESPEWLKAKEGIVAVRDLLSVRSD